jgi:hypothetical protein
MDPTQIWNRFPGPRSSAIAPSRGRVRPPVQCAPVRPVSAIERIARIPVGTRGTAYVTPTATVPTADPDVATRRGDDELSERCFRDRPRILVSAQGWQYEATRENGSPYRHVQELSSHHKRPKVSDSISLHRLHNCSTEIWVAYRPRPYALGP